MAEYELVVNYDKCKGCRLCETACAIHHGGRSDPKKSSVRIIKIEGEAEVISIPAKCMRCEQPPCETICPAGAISTHPTTGARLIDAEKCIGCNACVFICPFGAIVVDHSTRIAFVCDLCDGDPLCAKFCPWDALEYVKSDNISIRLRRVKAEKLLYLLRSPITPAEQTI